MSKNIRITALVLVLLLTFFSGFALGKSKGFNLNITNNPYGTTAPDKDKAKTTTEPTTAPAAPETDSKKPTKPLKAPKGADAVVAAYNKAVNAAKRSETLTIRKTVTLQMEPGAIKPGLAKGASQSAIKNAVNPTEETYTVKSGAEQTAKDILAPAGKASKLRPDDVIAAKAKAQDGGYVIVIKLKPETASFDGETTAQAKAHSACLTMPDPAAMTAFGVKLKTAEVNYTGTTLRATVDNSGKLTKVEYTLPFSAALTGKFYLSKWNAAVDGTMTETMELSA